jgi:hypothetical protein
MGRAAKLNSGLDRLKWLPSGDGPGARYLGPNANLTVPIHYLERDNRPIRPCIERLALMYARHGIPEEWPECQTPKDKRLFRIARCRGPCLTKPNLFTAVEQVLANERRIFVRVKLSLDPHLAVIEWIHEDMLDLARGKKAGLPGFVGQAPLPRLARQVAADR